MQVVDPQDLAMLRSLGSDPRRRTVSETSKDEVNILQFMEASDRESTFAHFILDRAPSLDVPPSPKVNTNLLFLQFLLFNFCFFF